MIESQNQYFAPELVVYGRLENVTMIWSNPTSTDNICPGPTFAGSQNFNSGALCTFTPPPEGEGSSMGDISLELIDPDLAAEISGDAPSLLTGEGS